MLIELHFLDSHQSTPSDIFTNIFFWGGGSDNNENNFINQYKMLKINFYLFFILYLYIYKIDIII